MFDNLKAMKELNSMMKDYGGLSGIMEEAQKQADEVLIIDRRNLSDFVKGCLDDYINNAGVTIDSVVNLALHNYFEHVGYGGDYADYD